MGGERGTLASEVENRRLGGEVVRQQAREGEGRARAGHFKKKRELNGES